jgi:hypothetical protein
MHNDHVVARQPDIQLDPVGAERQAVIEGEKRVLGPKRGAPPMREDLRAPERPRGMWTADS